MQLGQPPCEPRKGIGGPKKKKKPLKCSAILVSCTGHSWVSAYRKTGAGFSSGQPHLLPCGWHQLLGAPAPPLVAEALIFDLPDVRNENRLMSRREKLLDFLRLLLAVAAKLLPMLEMSSWDWLRHDSFSRYLRRNSSFDPLWRNPTARKTAIIQIH